MDAVAPGRSTGTATLRRRQRQRVASSSPPLACGVAPSRRSPAGTSASDLRPGGGRRRRRVPRAGRNAATPRAAAGARGSPGRRRAGPGGRARCPPPVARRHRGPGPALRCAQHDHRPRLVRRQGAAAPGGALDRRDRGRARCPWRRPARGGRRRAGARRRGSARGRRPRSSTSSCVLGHPGQHRRIGDLVAVQVQDRQHGSVVDGVEEVVRMPGGGQRPGLRLAVPDDTADHQTGVVEGGAVGVREGVAQFAALVDGTGRLGRDVAGDPAGEGELPEQPRHALAVPCDVGVGPCVRAVEPGAGQHGRSAVSGSPDGEHVLLAGGDDPVQMGVDEVQARCGPPVAEQSWLDVSGAERLGEQGVCGEIDLPDRQVVGRAPVSVQGGQLVVRQGGPVGGRGDRHGDSRRRIVRCRDTVERRQSARRASQRG